MLLARGLFFADITIAEVGGGIDAVEREDGGVLFLGTGNECMETGDDSPCFLVPRL